MDWNVYAITSGVGEMEDINRIWSRMRLWISHYPQRFHLVPQGILTSKPLIYQVVYEPGDIDAYEVYKVAAQLYLQGHEDQAFDKLNELLAHYPNLGSATNLLGAIYMRRLDFKNAERAFLKSIALLPDSSIAMINLASIYQLEGQTERSRDYLRRALEVSTINGDQKQLQERLQTLYGLWDQTQKPSS